MLNSKSFSKTLVIDAIMIALYVVLNTLAEIPLGNIKITLGPLPVILVAFYFGIGHASVVAGIGEFISQLLGFGLTWTTPLWIIPTVARAVIICILLSPLMRVKKYENITKVKYYEYLIILLVSGLITTVLNTGVIALDAIIFGYYSYAYAFGDFVFRVLAAIISALIYTIISKAVIGALYKAKIFPTTA